MGAWGMKPFENDGALDFMAESISEFLNEGTTRRFQQALELHNESFIDSDEAEELIAAISFLIDENNDFIDLSDEENIKHINEVYECDIQAFCDYVKKNTQFDNSKMIQVLEVILKEENSDLAELWYEQEDEEWAQTVRDLIEILRQQMA